MLLIQRLRLPTNARTDQRAACRPSVLLGRIAKAFETWKADTGPARKYRVGTSAGSARETPAEPAPSTEMDQD